MSSKLPQPVATYLAGVNDQAIETALASFAASAIVQDEGRERRGLAAIREWIEETTAKYRPTIAVADVAETAAGATVTGLVSGEFPGSPAELRFAFTLDGSKISRLEIS